MLTRGVRREPIDGSWFAPVRVASRRRSWCGRATPIRARARPGPYAIGMIRGMMNCTRMNAATQIPTIAMINWAVIVRTCFQ